MTGFATDGHSLQTMLLRGRGLDAGSVPVQVPNKTFVYEQISCSESVLNTTFIPELIFCSDCGEDKPLSF